MAAISGLEALKQPCVVDMHTDSQYVRDGITKYINNWKRNGWRTAAKEPVKNQDLWQRLDAARDTPHRALALGERSLRRRVERARRRAGARGACLVENERVTVVFDARQFSLGGETVGTRGALAPAARSRRARSNCGLSRLATTIMRFTLPAL